MAKRGKKQEIVTKVGVDRMCLFINCEKIIC